MGDPLVMTKPNEGLAELPKKLKSELNKDEQLKSRLELWQKTQEPIEQLRYPRAAVRNKNKNNWGGHVWYQRHATPKKPQKEGEPPKGLQMLHITGELSTKVGNKDLLRAQPLPKFNPLIINEDVLYGYDLYTANDSSWGIKPTEQTNYFQHGKFEVYDPSKHTSPEDHSGGNQSQNRATKNQDRKDGR